VGRCSESHEIGDRSHTVAARTGRGSDGRGSAMRLSICRNGLSNADGLPNLGSG
jgi:hypothetical protein